MMRKMIKLWACGLAAAALVSGCSKPAPKDVTTGATQATTAPTKAEDSSKAPSESATTAPAPSTGAKEALKPVDLSAIDNGTITLGKYKGIEVTMEAVDVTDQEVDAQVQKALDANPDYEDVTNRGVKDGDTVNIDYTGLDNGVAFQGGTAKGFNFVVGETNFIDGFKEGLMGAKTGQELSLNLKFPNPYQNNPSLAGKPVVFKVKINSIRIKKPAVLNDAFVQRVSTFKTVDEYKADMKQKLLKEKQAQADQKKQNDILTAVIKDSKIAPNQAAIDANYNNFVVNYTNQATSYGMDLASLAGIYGMDEDSFKKQLKTMAQSAVEQRLVFHAIAQKEGITITDADRESLAKQMGYKDDKTMEAQVGKFTVDDYLISTKAMDFLTKNAIVK